ncbi:hypothetical protein R11007_01543 [Ralstonia holmesii]|nr:hypothetical protein R11007_01543 [Ralstonia sp. LMG 32967]
MPYSIFPSLNSIEVYLRLLASPYFALGFLAPIVLAMTRILYIWGRDRTALYWKKFALVADMMSIVGLVGLSALAGRTLLDEDLRGTQVAEQAAGTALQARISDAKMAACALSWAESPTRRAADAIEFCNALKGIGGIWDTNIDWDSRYKQLLSIPPDNGYAYEARNIGVVIKQFEAERSRVPQAEWALKLTTQLTSATLIVTCLLMAICSLALKLAKSSWEIKEEIAKQKSRTEQLSPPDKS